MKKIAIRTVGLAAIAAGYYLFVLGEPDTYQAFCNAALCALGVVGVFELQED